MLDSIRSKEILKKIGETLHQKRKEKKLSMRKLANIAGVDYSQIDKIEKGRLNCTILTIIAIGEALEISVGELLEYNK